jgi:C1A family cysteine protease
MKHSAPASAGVFLNKYCMSDLREYIKYLPSQDNVGCCTASASLLAIEIIMSMNSKPTHFSRLFPYYNARKMQGRVGQLGTELRITLESMNQYGVCLDRAWPFSPHRVNVEPSIAAYDEALKYKVRSYEPAEVDNFNTLIDIGIPIIVGLHTGRLFKHMGNELTKQCYKPVNSTDNTYFRGHAVTIVGYTAGAWIIANSFGLRWGDHGYGILPYECSVDIGEAYIVRDFAGISAGKNFHTIDK